MTFGGLESTRLDDTLLWACATGRRQVWRERGDRHSRGRVRWRGQQKNLYGTRAGRRKVSSKQEWKGAQGKWGPWKVSGAVRK